MKKACRRDVGENDPDVPSFTYTLGKKLLVKERDPDSQSWSALHRVVAVAATSRADTAKSDSRRDLDVCVMAMAYGRTVSYLSLLLFYQEDLGILQQAQNEFTLMAGLYIVFIFASFLPRGYWYSSASSSK